MKKLALTLVGLMALLALGAAILFAYRTIKPAAPSPNEQAPTLLTTNPAYASAEPALKAGAFSAAYALYQQALNAATSSNERGQIQYREALALIGDGEYASATPILADVGSNTSYALILRAYALENIVSLYDTYVDPQITSVVISAEPYKGLIVSGEPISVAYRKLADLAAAFYPTAQAELDKALWYATDIASLKAHSTSASTSAQIASDQAQLASSVAAATADMPRIEGNPLWAAALPVIYYRAGDVSAALVGTGVTSSLGDPDTLYQKAIEAASSSPGGFTAYAAETQSFAYYHDAAYLAGRYGVARASQIQSLLANLYSTAALRQPAVLAFFRVQAQEQGSTHDRIVLLASFDPKFAAFIKSLGWSLNS